MCDYEDKTELNCLTMDYDCSVSLNAISWKATNQAAIYRTTRGEIQCLLFTRFSENPVEK